MDLGRDLLAAGLQHARGLRPWAELQAALERAAIELRLAAAGPLREVRGMLRLRWHERAAALTRPLVAFAEAAQEAAAGARDVAEAAPDFPKLEQRARTLALLAARFGEELATDRVRWVDLGPQQVRLVESPLDVREMLTQQREASPKAWVFTSATLGDDEALSWFTSTTGTEDAELLRVGSPFDYPAHARAWVPPDMPLPNAATHSAVVGALAARCAAALAGRTFVLTTTLRALGLIAEALRAEAAALGTAMQVLVQGSEPRRALLQRYGDGRDCVLVGSASFWEGIDMPGDALQCVLIDKLPFPPPGDPLVEARVRQMRHKGGNPFDDYFVAEAAVALKQGAGRLIRTETDRGLLVLCDPRLRSMAYGRRLLAALPPMGVVSDEAEAMEWLRSLAAAR
jgi:ATP-dependent DNA helicase DinG